MALFSFHALSFLTLSFLLKDTMKHLCYLILLLCIWVPEVQANPVVRPHTTVQLVSESKSIAPGQRLALAIRMTPTKGWHTYYKNYGSVGMETAANWTLPTGFTASPLEFPTPIRIAAGDLVNFGYIAPSTLLLTLQAPAQIDTDTLPISLALNWLVCSDEICVPESANLQLRLLRGDGAADPAQRKLFMQARDAMPKAMTWPANYVVTDKIFHIQADIGAGLPVIEEALFYPTQMSVMASASPQKFSYDQGKLRIETASELQGDAPELLSGVLSIKTKGNPAIEGFAINAKRVSALPSRSSASSLSPIVALGFALIGGLLLNLMPCVFPILSLKALTLAKSGASATQAKRDALWYTIGVIATFLALAATLFVLRTAGQSIGWGFQLQDPRVVGMLALLMLLVALNLFGVFEINTQLVGAGQNLTEKAGGNGAFWTGALAVLVATPCTAPFMAGALGAAFVLPPAIGLLIFAGLGLGMALPFLLLGYVPALRGWLPKPGAWMAKFKMFLGVPMLATAAWLVWVAAQQAGKESVFKLLIAALVFGLAAWVFGRSQNKGSNIAKLLAALLALGGVAIPLTLKTSVARNASSHVLAGAPYSDAALAAARATGKPVFVYFTADWCISCKVNERSTLANSTVQKAFAEAGAIILIGDWTKRDDAIARTLASHGRSGVPLYLWFPAGSVDAQILPQILTPDSMLNIIASK
jgi:thiol:disulfide interchange protein